MSKATEIKEKTIPGNYRLPESLVDKIVDRSGKLTRKTKKTVTKTEVVIELIQLGLQNVK